MEDFQEEIVKLLDVITVILAKLDEIGDNVVSEIKVILDKSRNEVALIQNSIIEKLKQEDPFKLQEQHDDFHDVSNGKLFKHDDLNLIIKSEITQEKEVYDDVIANDEEVYGDVLVKDEKDLDPLNTSEITLEGWINDEKDSNSRCSLSDFDRIQTDTEIKVETVEENIPNDNENGLALDISDQENLVANTTPAFTPILCGGCGKAIKCQTELKVHLCSTYNKPKRKRKTEPFHGKIFNTAKHICKMCGSDFTSKIALVQHKVEVHNKLLKICDICGNAYDDQKALSAHKRDHKKKECDVCIKAIPVSHFKRHRTTCHKKSEKRKKLKTEEGRPSHDHTY